MAAASLYAAPRWSVAHPGLVTLRGCGAVGDGVTDDTAAWERFRTTPASRRYVEAGRYVIANLGRLPQGILEGDGPGISVLWQPSWSREVDWGSIPGKCGIRDLTFFSDAMLGESHRLSMAPMAEWVKLDNVAVQGFRDGYGFYIGDQARYVDVNGSYLSAGFWGLTIQDASNVTVGGGTTIHTTGNRAPLCIEPNVYGASDIRIAGGVIDGGGGATVAVHVWGGSASIGTVTIERNVVRNASRGFQFLGVASMNVLNNQCHNIHGAMWNDHGGTNLVRTGNTLNGVAA